MPLPNKAMARPDLVGLGLEGSVPGLQAKLRWGSEKELKDSGRLDPMKQLGRERVSSPLFGVGLNPTHYVPGTHSTCRRNGVR